MSDLRAFSLSGISPVPWRNGGGLTREIGSGSLAASDAGAAACWDWRLSVASIAADGPFSSFAGIERSAVLLDGSLDLQSEGETLSFASPGDLHCFPGERAFRASLRTDRARLFNIMTRRGRLAARVQVHRGDVELGFEGAQCACLLVVQGGFDLECASTERGNPRLAGDQGLLWRRAPGTCRLFLRSRAGCVITASLI